MNDIIVKGMHGLGDNIRQRAILRQLIERGHKVWLETSWVSVYHDLPINLLMRPTSLRTQTKNAERERTLFSREVPPANAPKVGIWYPPAKVRETGSVMAAMCQSTHSDPTRCDFTLPVPMAWRQAALRVMEKLRPTKPIMLYRPLVDRPSDWTGCNARNPDHDAYLALFNSIRDKYYVISVADLVPGVEWIVGHPIEADAEFHAGELPFETLAALTYYSSLVFCSPGFAGVLGQAVGTKVACVFGGYEQSKFFFAGRQLKPCLGIDPINPCDCFSHSHHCRKEIDLVNASRTLQAL